MRKLSCFLCLSLFLLAFVGCNGGDNTKVSVDSDISSEIENNEILPESGSTSEDIGGDDKEEKTYTIELDVGVVANSKYILSVDSITLKYGDEIELPTPTCDGYTFKYWSWKGQKFTDSVFTLDKDIVLVAEWKENDWPDNF